MEEKQMELIDLNSQTPRNKNEEEDVGDYDPHQNRNMPKATSNAATLIHLLKGSLGTGIMAMPQAFLFAGYAFGVLNTIFSTFISTYCLIVLARCQYILCKRHRLPVLTYPISMKMALQEGPPFLRSLSKIAIPFVDGFLVVYQGGICCVYVVFVARNIKELMEIVHVSLDVKVYMVILFIPFVLMMCVRNLKLLAPFSLFSNFITFVGVAMIFYYYFKDGLTAASESIAFNSLSNFPSFFGTTLFAINGVGVVIAVENNMKTPKSFAKVMTLAMTIICVLYTLFGLFGYLKYGKKCEGTITVNVPRGEVISQLIQGIFVLATFISYGLQGYVPISIVWGAYLSKKYENSNHKLYYEFLVRIVMVIITIAIAAAIPFIGLLINLVGALCISVLGFVCPALMEICVMYKEILPQKTITKSMFYIKNGFFIVVGIVGLVIGTYSSVVDVVDEYNKE